jgi:arginase
MSQIKRFVLLFIFLFLFAEFTYGTVRKGEPMQSMNNNNPLKVAIVLQPYTGHRRGPELSPAPEIIYKDLVKILGEMGIEHGLKEVVKLTSEEESEYGVWHHLGLADGHLGKIVARLKREGEFPLGLLANCNSLMGMLAGLQHSGLTRRPLVVGLIWLDAHADFNTPETTLSGMLGGMPVACAAGKCLFRLRFKAGLDPAIPTRNILMMAVRDVDPLEQELIDNSNITMISTEDLISQSEHMKESIEKLSQRVDTIYIHIDLDVLDAADIPGANFPSPHGPTADQLGESLKLMMSYGKVGALGIASFPLEEKGRKKSLKSTLKVIRGALAGLKSR